MRAGHELKLVYPQPGAPPEDFAGLAFERFSLQPMDGPDAGGKYQQGRRLLPEASGLAAEPADAQDFGNPLMWEVTKSFYFDAAHTLSGTTLGAAAEEVHGHSFRAEVAVEGTPDPATGMVLDLGRLEEAVAAVRKRLDHKLLNKIEGPGQADAGKPRALHLRRAVRHVGADDAGHASTATAATKPAPTGRAKLSRDTPAPAARRSSSRM